MSSVRMRRQLPYRIPGPAGDLTCRSSPSTTSHQTVSSSSTRSRHRSKSQQGLDIDPQLFCRGAWQTMLQAEKLRPYGAGQLGSCVRAFERAVKGAGGGKVARIILRVIAIEFVAQEARVLLGDVTGIVVGTVHGEVFKKRKQQVDVGAVIVLQDISGLFCCEDGWGRSGGGWTKAGSALHLSIHLPNIVRVFESSAVSPLRANQPHRTLTVKLEQLQSAYTPQALAGIPDSSLITSRPCTIVSPVSSRLFIKSPTRPLTRQPIQPSRPPSRATNFSGRHIHRQRMQHAGVIKRYSPPGRQDNQRPPSRQTHVKPSMHHSYPRQQRPMPLSRRQPHYVPRSAPETSKPAATTPKATTTTPRLIATTPGSASIPSHSMQEASSDSACRNGPSDEMLDELFVDDLNAGLAAQCNPLQSMQSPAAHAGRSSEPKTEQISKEDLKRDAMIQSLLDGLDASQFVDM